MKKMICRFAAVLMAASMTCALCACQSKDAYYQFDKDKIPSINSVVGERKITAVEDIDRNEFPTLQFTYESDSVFEDLSQYTQLLKDQGWTAAGAYDDLQTPPGIVHLYKESSEENWMLNIRISYEENQYTVRVTKVEATISQG